MWVLDSSTRWASAASDIGSVRSTIGRTTPLPISGHMLAHGGDDGGLLGERTAAQGRCGDRGALVQQSTQIEVALDAALQADDGEPAVDGERVHIPVQVLRTDDVEDDVRARPVRRLAQFLDEVLLPVVDQDVGSELRAARQLLGTPRGHRDPCAHGLGQLDRHRADTAGASVHQQRLTGAQMGHHEHVRPDRGRHLGQRRDHHRIDAVRHG